MPASSPDPISYRYEPLTPDRWDDIDTLFGPRGACGGCWCMWWRLPKSVFDLHKGDSNRGAFKNLVETEPIPLGIMAYHDAQPVGWCAVAPRSAYSRLEHSRILKPVDNQPVWSVVCFFVAKPYRRRGLSVDLLRAAVEFASQHGAWIVEGYPVEPRSPLADAFVYTGLASAFARAGFKEVARRSETRPIMRYTLEVEK